MSRCEFHQIAVSSLVDGALPQSELLPTLDHLLACPACRAFYRDARALGGLLAPPAAHAGPAGETDGPAALEEPEPSAKGATEEVWRRIAAESTRRRLPVFTGRVARAAAVLLLAAGGWWAASRDLAPLPGRGGAPREVVLGAASGQMSEARFVEIATEVLEAEPRYRREMLRVLAEVARETGRPEGPVEDGTLTEDDGSPREESGSPRGRA